MVSRDEQIERWLYEVKKCAKHLDWCVNGMLSTGHFSLRGHDERQAVSALDNIVQRLEDFAERLEELR